MKTVLTISILFFALIGFGQDIKLDKLEMWFDQGNYSKVYRKSKALIKKDEYVNHPVPYLWKALSKTHKDIKKDKSLFKALMSTSKDFQTFAKKENAAHYLNAYNNQILDYQELFLNEIAVQKELNPKKAKELFIAYDKTFKSEIKYDDIKTQPLLPKEIEPEVTDNTSAKSKRKKVIATAKKYKGVPYKWGGSSPDGFDCSGYTSFVFDKHNIQLSRIASDQGKQVKKIKKSKAQPGDLAFFGSGKKITHVGIVISDPNKDLEMIHASSSKGITISNVDTNTYWKPRLLFVGSIIE